MKTILISLFLLLNLTSVYSQLAKQKLDSLLSLSISPSITDAISELEKIDSICDVEHDTRTQSDCLLFLSTFYTNTKNYFNADRVISKALDLSNSANEVSSDFEAIALNNAADFEIRKGNRKKAISLYLDAIRVGKKNNLNSNNIQIFYHNIADNYRLLGDFDNAIQTCKESIKHLDSFDYSVDNEVAKAHELLNLAIAFFDLGENQKSILVLEKALKTLDSLTLIKKVHFQIKIAILHSLISYQIEIGNIQDAKKTFELLNSSKYSESYRSFNIHELKGLLKEQKEGVQELKIALEKGYDYYHGRKGSPTIGRIHGRIADIHIQTSEYDSALFEIQKGLQFYDDSLSSDITDQPLAANLSVFPKTLDLLLKKGRAANLAGYEELSTQSYILAVDLLDQLKSNYITDGSKFFISSKAQPIYEEVLIHLSNLYSNAPSPQLMDQIYSVMERNKSNILFNKMKYKFDLLAADIPKEIIENSYSLNKDQAYFKKILEEESAKEKPDSLKINQYEKKIFDLTEEAAFQDQYMKNNHAEFYNYKDEVNNIVSLKSLQSQLEPKTAILEYFVQDSSVYRLTITNYESSFTDLTGIISDKDINIASQLLSQPPDESDGDQLENILSKLGSDLLYENILKKTDHLIIIADGILRKIPFSTLQSSFSGTREYLVKTHRISNYFSIQQFYDTKASKPKGNSKILCLAPVFDGISNTQRSCDESELGKLPFAQKEKEYLEQEFDGLYLSSNDIKTSDLISNLKDFDIIHLATHACLNLDNPMLSKIHFNDGALTNYDIQNLNVQPELVVLSACNTAQGSIQEGEGVISLTRGFFEAGVKSLQSSLWAIDDYSSSEIVKGMYSYLKNGLSKSEALRFSKLDYLKNADRLRSHPYYWAGIIHIGNDQPLFNSSSYIKLSFLLLLPFLFLLFYLHKKK